MNTICRYFPNLTDKQIHQFEQLPELYSFWNGQINVISRKDIDNLQINHVLHSLSIAKLISFKDTTSVLDVGTGGGFPGIPLAILFPCVDFHLIDAVGKKIKVTQDIANQLGLANVTTDHIRAEQLKDNYDFILSRAVTQLPVFYSWVHQRIAKHSFNDLPNGMLCLKGGDITEERKQIPCPVTEYPVSMWFEEAYFAQKNIVYIPCLHR
ncbi:MAG: 16S rRNA (guanine(527)-N(7))-methyltransferase RsmG [Bacteroidales bacterium]|jgi:16S rRNA (guanine527-N7)-methyltransferase|nr:16S rRNA (guanine(527)-N(7))-methyltransferase RsmG [Bacteroidales bacterium]